MIKQTFLAKVVENNISDVKIYHQLQLLYLSIEKFDSFKIVFPRSSNVFYVPLNISCFLFLLTQQDMFCLVCFAPIKVAVSFIDVMYACCNVLQRNLDGKVFRFSPDVIKI